MLPVHATPYIQEIRAKWIPADIHLFIKREDVIHKEVSGNKWRKLQYNLLDASQKGAKTLVTFGGAYSNHIYATAAAANEAGFSSVGIIRGEESSAGNPTLSFAREMGMELVFVDRESYRDKKALLKKLTGQWEKPYVLPEGGTNCLAIEGTRQIVDEQVRNMDIVVVPVGTGGTMAGIVAGMPREKSVLGISALKGNFLHKMIQDLLDTCGVQAEASWSIDTGGHCGGYAKISDELIAFITDFKHSQGILLEPLYTGKMLFRLKQLIEAGAIPGGSSVCAIHTGGLQGWNGIKERFGVGPP